MQYVGTYTRVYETEEVQITIKMEAGKLTVQYDDDNEAISCIAIGTDLFMSQRSGSWGAIVHFVRDAAGNVNSLLQGGIQYQRHG